MAQKGSPKQQPVLKKRISFSLFDKRHNSREEIAPPTPRDYDAIGRNHELIVEAYNLVSDTKKIKEKHYSKAAELLQGAQGDIDSSSFNNLPPLSLEKIKKILTYCPGAARAIKKDPRLQYAIKDFRSLLSYLKCSFEFSNFVLRAQNHYFISNGAQLIEVLANINAQDAYELLLGAYPKATLIETDSQLVEAAKYLCPKAMEKLLENTYFLDLLVDSFQCLELVKHSPQQVELLEQSEFYQKTTSAQLAQFLEVMAAYSLQSGPHALALGKIYHHGYANVAINDKNKILALKYFRLAKKQGEDVSDYLDDPVNEYRGLAGRSVTI